MRSARGVRSQALGVLIAGFGAGLLGACFDGAFTLGRPCEGDDDCGPSLTCTNGTCGDAVDDLCGNGLVDINEECDDGNDNDNDKCTNACTLAFCGDGIVESPNEECDDANDNDNDTCTIECKTRYATRCLDLLLADAPSEDTKLVIDADGPSSPDGPDNEEPFEVWCDMTHADGGWTLVMVASDDGEDTWTWGTRELLSTMPYTVGDLDTLDRDFMSPAYHLVDFSDLLFVHQPSGEWASYTNVAFSGVDTVGETTLANFIASLPETICDESLVEEGVPMDDGTLVPADESLDENNHLCDTDLYFNLGATEENCGDEIPAVSAVFGPSWHGDGSGDCDLFAEPAQYSLGPQGPCVPCASTVTVNEAPTLGFGNALGLNTGAAMSGENYIEVYVR